MKISVVGTGYVGLVTGACLAEMGNDVICADNNLVKIENLKKGILPIWEPGLDEIVHRNYSDGRLSFTTDIGYAVLHSGIIFIAVGTPPDEDGSADLQYVLAVASEIALYMNEYKIIVDKSTVPVGTADIVAQVINKGLAERSFEVDFDVVSNPEFLKEGAAVEDFMKPDRVIIGTKSDKSAKVMRDLYAPFCTSSDRIIAMSIRSAEMTKYAANAMLATKISFINEIALLCEKLGADVSEVRNGIGSDSRIGYKFIYPGVGYGGSCFPKDVQALIQMAHQTEVDAKVLLAVEDRNNSQKRVLFDKVVTRFGSDLSGMRFAIWGLSFKPQTDDMREAPSRVIINLLLCAGAEIKVYDPVAMPEAKKVLTPSSAIEFFENQYDALEQVDALLLITEWHQFRNPDFTKMKSAMKSPIIFDGRNQYQPKMLRGVGFEYFSIGRN
ncbi:MAG: UDP-glucose/GDP-mannose dehydrogenase family protein [Candidatus Cloacimonetes bacterium]|nr:UDP-glucose/GDP-mannose dehydrogenase family protein [Candidatus Cloacimonadota bacterium]